MNKLVSKGRRPARNKIHQKSSWRCLKNNKRRIRRCLGYGERERSLIVHRVMKQKKALLEAIID